MKYRRLLMTSRLSRGLRSFICLALGACSLLMAQEPSPQQSTTGPKPPPQVGPPLPWRIIAGEGGATNVIEGVPAYIWRHGCGPTALGMVLGYYDSNGYPDLYPGNVSTQTADAEQGIASQGSGTRGVGLQRHYEDYALPNDESSEFPMPDSSTNYPVGCHPDDSIADYMHTSWSADGNQYGWSWSSMIIPAFTNYVALRNPQYRPHATSYYMGSSLTWSVLTHEIDNHRPMVFLVDSTGDGLTDHFVPVIGYSEGPPQLYACWDTWNTSIRWEQFREMSASYDWGIWGGWSFSLTFPFPSLTLETNTFDDAEGGNGNGILDPGETLQETLVIRNRGGAIASNVTATLTTATPGVTMITATATYATVLANGTATNDLPFRYRVAKSVPCGTTIVFTNLITTLGSVFTNTFGHLVGYKQIHRVTNSYVCIEEPAPISNQTTTYSSLVIAESGTNFIVDVDVSVRLNHTYDADLVLAVQHPDATEVILANRRGGSGYDYGTDEVPTTFDDEAAILIRNGAAPFAAAYRPDGALSNFNGKELNGTWRLRVSDQAAGDTGTVLRWSMTVISQFSSYPATLFNHAPLASNLTIALFSDTVAELTLTGSDVDDDPLSFQTNSLPVHGQLSGFNPLTGAILYTPMPGYCGTDSFAFVVNDGITNSAPATVTIHVTGRSTLTVITAHGVPSPPAGVYTNENGSILTNWVNTPDTWGTTQYVCTGWELSGNDPASGSLATMAMTHTNPAVLTWQWATNFFFTRAAGENGNTVGSTNGWYATGDSATVTAVPVAYWHFEAWTGDVPPAQQIDNPLTLFIDRPRTCLPLFAPNRATNNAPEWWLAQHGWTNNFNQAALDDPDGDSLFTWQEWVAGSDPTNRNSVFRFTSAEMASPQGLIVRWPSRSSRFYNLRRATNLLAGTNTFILLPGASDLPATPPENSYTDAVEKAGLYFYKIDVRE